jgi:protein-arginine kinase activator protein McsA
MQTTDIPKTTIKKRVLTGVHIECEPPSSVTRYCGSIEREAKALESWASEVKDFIRDHRSMDPMYLEIVRDYSDLCATCEREWEPMIEDGKTCCASCGCELESEISPANSQAHGRDSVP